MLATDGPDPLSPPKSTILVPLYAKYERKRGIMLFLRAIIYGIGVIKLEKKSGSWTWYKRE
jgi:hypothetical protein